MEPRRIVAWAAVTVGAATAGAGLARLPARGHSCVEVDRLSPPSTVAGSCIPHDPQTHLCSEHPVEQANLSITQCTPVPVSRQPPAPDGRRHRPAG